MKRYSIRVDDLIAEATEVVLVANAWRTSKAKRSAAQALVGFFQRFNVPAEATSNGVTFSFEAPSRRAADDLHFAAVCHLATVKAEPPRSIGCVTQSVVAANESARQRSLFAARPSAAA